MSATCSTCGATGHPYFFGHEDSGQPHPCYTSTGSEGLCDLCGLDSDALVHTKHDELTNPQTQPKESSMSDTLTIAFEDLGNGRTRATIENIHGGDFGVMAVGSTRAQAASAVVEAADRVNPKPAVDLSNFEITIENNYQNNYSRPSYYSRHLIEILMRDLASSGGAAQIEYEDKAGHVTTRTVEVKEFKPSGNIVVFDRLRQAVRTLRLAGIKSAREV